MQSILLVTIQDDLIQSLHNVMLHSIKSSVDGDIVSIIADETSDCGHHEHLAFVLRYFVECETFVSLSRLTAVDAEAIFIVLHRLLLSLGKRWTSVNSVCFDGVSVMSGSITGIPEKCKQQNSKLVYVHCYVRCLTLVLVDDCISHKDNLILLDFFGTVQFVYDFLERSQFAM